MDPIAEFERTRAASLAARAANPQFRSSADNYILKAMEARYVYNFDWLGRPIIQFPQDVQAIQEIIWETRPDIVVETGIAHGGSLILSASMLALLDYADAVRDGSVLDPAKPKRRVIGIDIDIRPHNRSAIEAHPMMSRITLVEGSSIDTSIVDKVGSFIPGHSRVMVCLDSMHTHDHVLRELRAYGDLVSRGCYCIVFDAFVDDLPAALFPDRPWGPGNNPKTAVHAFLAENDGFEIDAGIYNKLMVSSAPDGFLKRVK